ncbi:MAG: efflux RND transporter periplasmic adaptor subunit [Pirellulaceae bacterium]|nr:efflux RND transporter periplasmic adaptor subunit [Pirellulaceae bacterium]
MTKMNHPSPRLFALTILLLIANTASSQQTSEQVFDGFTEPKYDIMVAATELGRIDRVLVQEGDRVRQGDVVAQLDDAVQLASVKIAQLQAEQVGEVNAAKADVLLHRTRTDHLRQLSAERMARPDELRRAEADLKIAEARETAALEQVQLRKLELDRFRLQFERRKVIAPMDGVVAKVFHHPGEYITPADPAVIRLLVTDQLYGVFNVPIEDAGSLRIGSEVRVYLRSQSRTMTAKVYGISAAIDGESGTLKVRVLLPNEDSRLLAGDRCTMQMVTPTQRQRSAAVPDSTGIPAWEGVTR